MGIVGNNPAIVWFVGRLQLPKHVVVVSKPTNVITVGQPIHEQIRLEMNKKWWENIFLACFALIFRGLGWPWIVTSDGFNTVIMLFVFPSNSYPTEDLVSRKHTYRVYTRQYPGTYRSITCPSITNSDRT